MGFLDVLRAGLATAGARFSDLARQHGGRIDHGIEKAARMVDRRTGGRYGDRIESGAVRVGRAVDRLAHRDEDDAPRA
ncbi:antitoxin [Streptomyces somaliensis]|uniref:antitoxin n=1 Tax=Streptomyces somaliensis TaxID=78355 RepID=UPI0020CF0B6E|nr:antitoxin [Streptomyces somaliensis]MCP9943986.1 antitoxin [Streptomyces somaliensis]MCP9962775.1 antitoxin [Streptomyces somaliensis]MCP9975611.1 antitoxin [Streptomyces somaliensis]